MVVLGVLFVFVLIVYAYKNHNREIEATTSVIHQIWSGSCRLSCRQNQQSGLSDNSGLEKGQGQGTGSRIFPTNQDQSIAGRSDCVCGTCPCAFIEGVFRTCRPVTTLYSQSIEFISRCYCNILRALSDACTTPAQGVDSGLPRQREAQVLSIKQLRSADNINFINQTAVKAEGEKKETEPSRSKQGELSRMREVEFGQRKEAVARQERELEIGQRTEASTGQNQDVAPGQRIGTNQLGSADTIDVINPSSIWTDNVKLKIAPSKKKDFVQNQEAESSQSKEIAFQNVSDATVIKELPKTVAVSQEINMKQSEATKYDTSSESLIEPDGDRKSCSKCIAKGKICIGSCPKANAKGNNKL